MAEVLVLSEMDMCVTSTIASPSGVEVCVVSLGSGFTDFGTVGTLLYDGDQRVLFVIRRVFIIPLSRDTPHNLEEVRTTLQLSLTSQSSSRGRPIPLFE